MAGEGTLGGILSTNVSRRPPFRNQLLGLKAVSEEGELLSFGAKVMKNVAGYDAARLFQGAWGALGVVVELTLRLHPVPPETLEAGDPVPPNFSLSAAADLHRKIKSAFDPRNLFNPTLFSPHDD